MLLHYQFRNVKSFAETVEFDMLAPKNRVRNRFSDNFNAVGGETILKSAVIIGENGSGKSNFIESLELLQSLLDEKDEVRAARSLIYYQHDREDPQEADSLQTFEIEVLAADSLIYRYLLAVDWMGIVEERLQYREPGRKTLAPVFHSERVTVREESGGFTATYTLEIPALSSEIRKLLDQKLNTGKTLGTMLLTLSILGIDHTRPFLDWMRNTLCLESSPINNDLLHSAMKDEDDLRILRDPRYLGIFRLVDESICDVRIDEEAPFVWSEIVRRNADGGEYTLRLAQDSGGVREFFSWSIQLFKVLYEDKVVFADEVDRALNPLLADRMIALLHGAPHRGQFVFTTHNVLHLNLNTYLKEQLYFVAKNPETLSSTLFSLADYPDIRYDTANIYEFYRKGLLGGTFFE